tara:strand:- start:2907 stop:3254 length:348 start_codon:yes stop_codon:yes gene_type:complete
MANWAEIDKNNFVIQVLVGDNNEPDEGESFMNSLGGTWIKTSYNAASNGFRKNFAGIGFTYDELRDAFIPPKPFDSWLLNEETCLWNSPIPYPNDDQMYSWNEENQSWDLRDVQG